MGNVPRKTFKFSAHKGPQRAFPNQEPIENRFGPLDGGTERDSIKLIISKQKSRGVLRGRAYSARCGIFK